MRGECFWSEEGVTCHWIKQARSTPPLIRESPTLSCKITHALEFCFCVVLKLPADLSFPIESFLLLRYSLSVSASHLRVQREFPVHPLFLVSDRNFSFVLGLARISCLLMWRDILTVTVEKARSQSYCWVPLLFSVHFSSLLHIAASSPEFSLSLVHLLSLGHSYYCKRCS